MIFAYWCAPFFQVSSFYLFWGCYFLRCWIIGCPASVLPGLEVRNVIEMIDDLPKIQGNDRESRSASQLLQVITNSV
jgi:hypothetical protein